MTQPIEMRLNEMISGVRSDVAVKLFGDDFDVLVDKAEEIEKVLRSIDGNADVAVEQITGQPVLQIKVKQDEIARYGVSAKQVLDLVESLGSFELGEVFEGQLRFPLGRPPAGRHSRAVPKRSARFNCERPPANGFRLARLADIRVDRRPVDDHARMGIPRGSTSRPTFAAATWAALWPRRNGRIEEQVKLPPGRYHIEWGGQFENLISARQRLMVVVPVALVLIFGLLYLTYNNVIDAIRVFTGVRSPGPAALSRCGFATCRFPSPRPIGFVALSGVAVLDDMLLVSYIRQLRARGVGLEEAVEQAAMTRLRPVLMTTLVAALGFVPMALNTGMGAEVQRPLATVVIGGVISAMVMSLLVLRVLYMVFAGPAGRERRVESESES